MLSRYFVILSGLFLVLVVSACNTLGAGENPPGGADQPAAPAGAGQESGIPPSQQEQQPQVSPTTPPQPTPSWVRGSEADKAPEFMRAIGEKGTDPGQLSQPISVDLDAQGNFYIGDNKSLQKFAPDGKYLLSYGPDGYAGFSSAVVVGPDGRIYRSDPIAHGVTIYTSKGKEVGILGEPGSEGGQFDQPFGLAFDGQGNLYIVDRGNFRVQKFGPDGEFLMSFGSRGEKNGQFINPRDVAVDQQGNIYVTDLSTYMVQKFSPDGDFLMRFGQAHIDERMWLMRGIAIDNSGHIYVVDGFHARIQVFDMEGNYLLEFGLPGGEPGRFRDPEDITIRNGKLYVADKGNDRIQEFALQQW